LSNSITETPIKNSKLSPYMQGSAYHWFCPIKISSPIGNNPASDEILLRKKGQNFAPLEFFKIKFIIKQGENSPP